MTRSKGLSAILEAIGNTPRVDLRSLSLYATNRGTGMSLRITAISVVLVAFQALGAGAPRVALLPDAEAPQVTLDPAFVQISVETLAGKIEAEYFDLSMGAKVAAGLREALARGHYAKAPNLEGLATLITSDLYALAKDRHLSLQTVKALPPQPAQGPAFKEETREERGKHENYGFQKMEILPGNVGYLRVTAFYRPEETRETIAEAMAFLSHAGALIVDLRDHGGGATPTVALFISYFLDSPDMPLFAITPRLPAAPRPYLTEPKPLAHRNSNRPTFLLTSRETCSGGEGVAFLLQERHRAVVIGEPTWGGANQVPNPRPIAQGLQAFIPNGRMGSALTGRNWEGGGVLPDVPTDSGRALSVAHAMALKALLGSAPEGAWRGNLHQELARVENQAEPASCAHCPADSDPVQRTGANQ